MKTRSAIEIWETTLGALQIQVTRANYETWLKNTTGLSYQPDIFVVGVPTTFAAEWLEKRLHSLIQKTLVGIVGHDLNVQFQVSQVFPTHPSSYRTRSSPKECTPTSCQLPLNLNPKYTFDTFITGKCNRLAYMAALEIAKSQGHRYNPLFIYGNTGLGKTHLLQAIGHVALNRGLQILYTSAEKFTNEFINAIREKKTEEFRQRYRSPDMLLVDDIHFILGKEQTQESFFYTFNDLYNANHQIAMTSDRPPRALSLLGHRLCSRLECGLIADVQPPDLETRLAILQAKAIELGANLSSDILHLIATKTKHNIRELEGVLNRITAYAKVMEVSITPELATKVLKDISSDTQQRPTITPALIVDTVANYFSLAPEILRGQQRSHKTAQARHIAIYLIREKVPCTLIEIGRELGGKDHSSVIHACKKIASEIDSDTKLRQQIAEIRELLHQ